MILRIVKMTFREEEIHNFESLFKRHMKQIRNFDGCQHLELWQDQNQPNVFFTYSHWTNPQALEAYRHSPLFNEVWAATKALFDQKPQAWSVTQKQEVTC